MAGAFAGKVIVVAGGSRGIGRGIAAAFAGEGAQLVLAASSSANLETSAAAIENSSGARPEVCAADLRTLAGCGQVLEFAGEFAVCGMQIAGLIEQQRRPAKVLVQGDLIDADAFDRIVDRGLRFGRQLESAGAADRNFELEHGPIVRR